MGTKQRRPLTVNQLHKLLGKFIEQGHGKRYVTIDKRTFYHPLEDDGAVILDAYGCHMRWINMIDDDGYTATNKDGSEKYKRTAVLHGWEDHPDGKPLVESEATQ